MVFPPTPDGILPDYYQQADAEQVFRLLAAGKSCALVGVGSVGKSNLLQFITRDDVKERYLGAENAPFYALVLLNPHQMIHPQQQAMTLTGDAWAGYEIMLNRLRRTLAIMVYDRLIPEGKSASGSIEERVANHYNLLFDSQPLLVQTGIRQLEDSVTEVLSLDRRMRIVFMFDEFEAFLHLPDYFWQSLRGVRDDYKQRLMYLTASRTDLTTLAEQHFVDAHTAQVMEGFLELFHGFTHYLSRLDVRSAQASIERLERRYDVKLSPEVERILTYTTGRHHGLLRRGFRVASKIYDPSGLTDEAFLDLLLKNTGIRHECQAIYDSLSVAEQTVLKQVVHLTPVAEDFRSLGGSGQQAVSDKDRCQPACADYSGLCHVYPRCDFEDLIVFLAVANIRDTPLTVPGPVFVLFFAFVHRATLIAGGQQFGAIGRNLRHHLPG